MTLSARPRLAALFAAASLAVGGCATVGPAPTPAQTRPEPPSILRPPKPLQCVPYARAQSGIELYGDAVTWWDQARDKYRRGPSPIIGGVLVMRGYGGAPRGHVAVVRRIMGPRDILIDHANWLNEGEITRNVPVRDVSPAGDWSAVQVWNIPSGKWGQRTYSVQGFISR